MADSSPSESNDHTQAGNPAEAKKAKVLVADDSKLVRKTATKILGTQFDLLLAEDGEDAWQQLTTDDTVQVLFTDLGMPNLDGYGLIQRIRQSDNDRLRGLPVIVITGAAEEESVKREVFEIGATDFIGKPFKSTEIIARADAHANYYKDKEQLQKSVEIDLLTNTLNRKGIDDKLAKDISFINRHKQNLAVVVFELDNFRDLAPKISKQTGEKIIQHVAKTLSKAIRREDSFGRYQFAKFVTILPMAKTEGVVQLAKRLCQHIRAGKLTLGDQTVELTLSVGIAAVAKGVQSTPEAVLQTAEKALENAKNIGRGEVQLLKLQNVSSTKKPITDISVDELLKKIVQNDDTIDTQLIQAGIKKILPLIGMLSEEQRRSLLKL
ncbi:GGDEF domain-containing response regulator [Aurantivibrio plasticivorans]